MQATAHMQLVTKNKSSKLYNVISICKIEIKKNLAIAGFITHVRFRQFRSIFRWSSLGQVCWAGGSVQVTFLQHWLEWHSSNTPICPLSLSLSQWSSVIPSINGRWGGCPGSHNLCNAKIERVRAAHLSQPRPATLSNQIQTLRYSSAELSFPLTAEDVPAMDRVLLEVTYILVLNRHGKISRYRGKQWKKFLMPLDRKGGKLNTLNRSSQSL